ncbi:MAG: hypothetical protein AAGB22_11820 [Bacteroidota bacterium]
MFDLDTSTANAIVMAPIDKIDLSTWLFTLKSEEYERCAARHLGCTQSKMMSGKRVMINVEQVAHAFMVQHFMETISEKNRVKVVSPHSVCWPNDLYMTRAAVTWELFLEPLTENTCTLYGNITVRTDDEIYASLIQDSKEVEPDGDVSWKRHLEEETYNFARNITQKALHGIWR